MVNKCVSEISYVNSENFLFDLLKFTYFFVLL